MRRHFIFISERPALSEKLNSCPFDYSQAGVYGSEQWKELARFDPELELKFDRVMEANERKQ